MNVNHTELRDQCLALLRASGVEVDDSSRAVIDFFFEAEGHVSLHDIENHLRETGLPLDLGRIRHTMQLLGDYGFAIDRQFPRGRVLYEHLHLGEHHDHLYCQRCGKIIEFLSDQIEQAQNQVAAEHGFHSFSHKLVIRGLCESCFEGPRTELVPLAAVQSGGQFRVGKVSRGGRGRMFGGGGMRRLSEHGIMVGAEGEVLSNHGTMVVVQIAGVRLALRQAQTQRILVEILN